MIKIKTLTKQNAIDALENIKRVTDDPEEARAMEDDLHYDFIFCCANGDYDSLEEVTDIANIIRQSNDISSPRWRS